MAEVHLDRYLQSWEEKLAKFSKDVERLERSLEHTKYPDDVRKKLDTAQKNVESARRRIEDANERIARDGEVVPVAVGLFMNASWCISPADPTIVTPSSTRPPPYSMR